MAVPELFGRYRAVRRLGVGAFATVWLAHDDQLDGSVAVKVLADNWASRGDVRERFLEEARMLRRADSDRVVRVHDIGELDDGRPYFVMTYADRGILADRLTDFPMPAADALWYAHQTALGVAVLHARGIIHRDIKPSNVLLRTGDDDTEQVLVSDLGLAKAVAVASGITLSAGTPGYMPPEQAEGVGLTFASDVYALGALTYRLLAGRLPHQVGSPLSVLSSAAEPVLPLEPATGLPRALDAVLRRALAGAPADRQADARAFARALSGAAGELLERGDPLPPIALGEQSGSVLDRVTGREAWSTGFAPRGRSGVRAGGARDPDAMATVITRTRPWTGDLPGGDGPDGDESGADGSGAEIPGGRADGPAATGDVDGRRPSRGRSIVLGAGIGVAVLLAAGLVGAAAQPDLVTRGRAVLAGDRVVRHGPFTVTVPAGWSQLSARAGSVPGMGVPVDQLTVASEVATYRTATTTPGVFLGMTAGARAGAVRSALRYPGCAVPVVVPAAPVPGWIGTTATRACGAATVVTWVGTSGLLPSRTLLVEVKVALGEQSRADQVLDSVTVAPERGA